MQCIAIWIVWATLLQHKTNETSIETTLEDQAPKQISSKWTTLTANENKCKFGVFLCDIGRPGGESQWAKENWPRLLPAEQSKFTSRFHFYSISFGDFTAFEWQLYQFQIALSSGSEYSASFSYFFTPSFHFWICFGVIFNFPLK